MQPSENNEHVQGAAIQETVLRVVPLDSKEMDYK